MNSIQPPAVENLASVASEVVRVMFMEGLNQFGATMEVMSRKRIPYGNALQIASLANEAFQKLPRVADHVRRRRKGYMNQADAFFHVQKAMEEATPVIPLNPRFAG
jgi:hypothetical protein